MMRLAAAFLIVFASTCASIETYPQRRCLVYGDRKFLKGQVIARREDGARLFQFDDPSQGDHGFRWVTDDGSESVKIQPCAGPSLIDARSPEFPRDPQQPPQP